MELVAVGVSVTAGELHEFPPAGARASARRRALAFRGWLALGASVLIGCASSPSAPPAQAPAAASPGAGARPAGVQAEPPACQRSFEQFDADHDGTLTEQEFLAHPHAFAHPKAFFAVRDIEDDGTLAALEFCLGWGHGTDMGPPLGAGWGRGMGPGAGAPGMGPGGGRTMFPPAGRSMFPGGAPPLGPGLGPGMGCRSNFGRFDANGDGELTREEFLAKPHRRDDPAAIFDARDGDGNGRLTEGEFCSGPRGPARTSPSAPGAASGPAPKGRDGGVLIDPWVTPGRGGGPVPDAAPAAGPGPGCRRNFAALDADGDGKVTKKEFFGRPHPRANPAMRFNASDGDRDGALTLQEFCAGAPRGR